MRARATRAVSRPPRGVALAFRRSQRRAHNKRALARLRRQPLAAPASEDPRVEHAPIAAAQTDASDQRGELGTINHKRAPGLLTLLELRPSADDCRSHEPSSRRRRERYSYEYYWLSEYQNRVRRAAVISAPLRSTFQSPPPPTAARRLHQYLRIRLRQRHISGQREAQETHGRGRGRGRDKWQIANAPPARRRLRRLRRNATQERPMQSPRRTHKRYF